jgi:MinD-like ATPase involved in chromosome partitioning or flagellar assembly
MVEIYSVELKRKLEEIYPPNSREEWVDLHISTSGLIDITIVSDRFKNIPNLERKKAIEKVIGNHQNSLGFLSLFTVEEARSIQLPHPHLIDEKSIRTWQDLALWSANPQNHAPPSKPELQIPRTITFYSFKGGVGRTTALTHVAWILAMRGRKVVAVDLDLEAPGLSKAFRLHPQPQYGIVDYFYERAYLPDEIEPQISIADIFGEVTIPDAPGRLFIVPAGSLNLDYIAKVDDLRSTTILDNGETLWSLFYREIQAQLKPDIILIDSRTGINEWGALSLLQAADEAMIFLYPNGQNRQGIDLLLSSLNHFGKLSINFVFSPVPDLSDTGMKKVNDFWQKLQSNSHKNTESEEELEEENEQSDGLEFLVVPYLQPIALAEYYPVLGLLDYYARIANRIDEDTKEVRLRSILTNSEQRWPVIESFHFTGLNAGDINQNLDLLFQKTANFDKFLDETTCLIRGRKGTGKTALYLLLLQRELDAKKLAHGRLDAVILLSGHGSYQKSRPSRDEFQFINRELQQKQGSWEAFWRAYLMLTAFQNKQWILPKNNQEQKLKFTPLQAILKKLPVDSWQSEHTKSLLELSTDGDLILLVKDALDSLDRHHVQASQKLWFLYDDLDEDFPERGDIRSQALTGLFQLIQACDARGLKTIRFKIFLREDIWKRLNFDNKSHLNGRDLLLQWNRVDFLRLALRQANLSSEFKDLVDRFAPVENIDRANEDTLNLALEILWGSRRRAGSRAKYVSRWVYERLTDSSGTTFPRSLIVLLQGAKEQELTYKGQSIQHPNDRLFRGKSLEVGLEKASEERCDAIRQEYPDLDKFFQSLEGKPALLNREDLQQSWEDNARELIADFNEFSTWLSEIGLAQWREKEQRYRFADIYVYGFKMSRLGTR